MELTVIERIHLLDILPREGDITTLRIVRQLREDLSFSEDEHKALAFEQQANGTINWKLDAEVVKEVSIGTKAKKLIVDALQRLNTEKKLREAHLPLFERFAEDAVD